MRRSRADWMTLADDVIVEWMLNPPGEPIKANPAIVGVNVDYGGSYVRQRMVKLRQAGLLEYYDEDRGIYQITDRGRAYLAGDLDAEDLERDEE